MILFSLVLIFYLPSTIFDLYVKCDEKLQARKRNYNVCRFTRKGEYCDYKKFDSLDDEPCMVGRKAGLTRINGVKVRQLKQSALGLIDATLR